MLITKKTEYALKALCYMALQPENRSMLISDLAHDNDIPKKFLEFILLSLRKGGILQSRIGKGGGYWLSQNPSNVTIGSIVKILDGDIALTGCFNGNGNKHCGEDDGMCCAIHYVMKDIQRSIESILDTMTLADMIKRMETEQVRRANTLDFCI